MQEILRYAKVNKIHNKTVSMTGVNKRTGKHVEFVWESVEDRRVLRALEYALQSGIFIKVSAGEKKGEPDFHFEEEKPPKIREDSYFTIFSYASEAGYNPIFLKELDHHLVTMDKKPIKELGRVLLNMTDKLGMVFYAKKQIAELKKSVSSYIEIRYHITNAIISAKACLDALAQILNEVYGIGYKKGKVDLATIHSDLLQKIIEANKNLGSKLKKYESWINRLTEYRDFVVHRIMLTTPPLGPTVDVSDLLKPFKVQIPSHPLTIDYIEKKDIEWVDAEDYCQELIEKLSQLIEIVCFDLLELIKSNTYFPL